MVTTEDSDGDGHIPRWFVHWMLMWWRHGVLTRGQLSIHYSWPKLLQIKLISVCFSQEDTHRPHGMDSIELEWIEVEMEMFRWLKEYMFMPLNVVLLAVLRFGSFDYFMSFSTIAHSYLHLCMCVCVYVYLCTWTWTCTWPLSRPLGKEQTTTNVRWRKHPKTINKRKCYQVQQHVVEQQHMNPCSGLGYTRQACRLTNR